MNRDHCDGLPDVVWKVIRRNTGGMIRAEPVMGGSTRIALVVYTESDRFFVKGVRDEPRARIELRVQPFLPAFAPRLLWHAEAGGYLLLGFEYAEGRHPDLSPGSPDLETVAATLTDLADYACPALPALPAEKRWAPYADDRESLVAISGHTLTHTDPTAENIVLGDRTWVVDWAWPTRGAPWLDTAAMVARLIHAGHTPAQADDWATSIPAWRNASRVTVRAYAEIRAAVARANRAPIVNAWESYLTWLRP